MPASRWGVPLSAVARRKNLVRPAKLERLGLPPPPHTVIGLKRGTTMTI
jgi:hypothetical protein